MKGKNAVWVGGVFLILAAFIAWEFYQVLHPSQETLQEYQKLTSTNGVKIQNALADPTQNREGILRDLFIWQGPQRLHTRIKSQKSTLRYQSSLQEEDKKMLIESFEGVTGWMQEALIYVTEEGERIFQQADGQWAMKKKGMLESIEDFSSLKAMQIIRFFEAQTGFYDYHEGTFTAQQVTLNRYLIPGHEIPEDLGPSKTLLMKGFAKQIRLQFNQQPNFQAESLKATFFEALE